MTTAGSGWLIPVTFLLFNAALSISVIADTRDEAAALAAERQAGIEALSKTTPSRERIPGYGGTSVPQAGYDPATLAAPESVTREQPLRDGEAAMRSLPSPVTLSPDSYGGPLGVQNDPAGQFDLDRLLSGTYEDCTPQMSPSIQSSEQRCDTWRARETSTVS